jgi:hypothetical protein
MQSGAGKADNSDHADLGRSLGGLQTRGRPPGRRHGAEPAAKRPSSLSISPPSSTS